MRTFKHKPTGKVFKEKRGYYVDTEGIAAPDWAVEATVSMDWEEIVERKPVVSLQGKDLYMGDNVWRVFRDWTVFKTTIQDGQDYADKYFSSRELAEQYVRDNKPVYPAGLVEYTLDYLENEGWPDYLDETIKKLKAFKK